MNRSAFAFLILLAFVNCALAQVVELQTRAASQNQYNSISHLSTGPAYGLSDGEVRGRYLRFVVTDAELYYDAPILRIEEFTYGDEGCCRRLTKARELEPSEALLTNFGPFAEGKHEIQLVRWLRPNEVEIKYKGVLLVLSELNKKNIKVRRGSNR